MDLNKTVRLQPDYLLERIDNEITVYHPTLTTSFFLNETGALIWALCDGTRSVA
ncbi:MAG: PqqD family protein, partial [Proteobacteria bacterium]|nr:PqqD family protein [Pseudomonadota bacterium]